MDTGRRPCSPGPCAARRNYRNHRELLSPNVLREPVPCINRTARSTPHRKCTAPPLKDRMLRVANLPQHHGPTTQRNKDPRQAMCGPVGSIPLPAGSDTDLGTLCKPSLWLE